MSTTKKLSFRRAVVKSGLLTVQQVDAALIQIAQADGLGPASVSDDRLAQQLIDTKLITAYQAGELLAGKTKFRLKDYLIVDYVGKGGMGQVYKAVHEVMSREVAVKVLPRERCTREAISYFEREIRHQAQLDHPNLVRAYDAGHDGNVYFLVTEFIPGTDLRRFVRGQGRLTEQHAAKVVMQAADGLEHAHQRGLIHRDVKPGNLLVTPAGSTKVSDLGLAGFVDESQHDPRAGRILGTADFLAPELIRSSSEMSPTSDVYSLGCTLYYAVTGKVPFPGGTPRDKIRRHLEEVPWHPLRLNPELSEEFVEIIADMMEKDAALRIPTAGEVSHRLEPWASEEGPIVPQPTKSRWLPPSIPTEEEVADTADVDDPYLESSNSGQISQVTRAVASAGEETVLSGFSSRPAIPAGSNSDTDAVAHAVRLTLLVAIPSALVAGGLAAWLLLWLLS